MNVKGKTWQRRLSFIVSDIVNKSGKNKEANIARWQKHRNLAFDDKRDVTPVPNLYVGRFSVDLSVLGKNLKCVHINTHAYLYVHIVNNDTASPEVIYPNSDYAMLPRLQSLLEYRTILRISRVWIKTTLLIHGQKFSNKYICF